MAFYWICFAILHQSNHNHSLSYHVDTICKDNNVQRFLNDCTQNVYQTLASSADVQQSHFDINELDQYCTHHDLNQSLNDIQIKSITTTTPKFLDNPIFANVTGDLISINLRIFSNSTFGQRISNLSPTNADRIQFHAHIKVTHCVYTFMNNATNVDENIYSITNDEIHLQLSSIRHFDCAPFTDNKMYKRYYHFYCLFHQKIKFNHKVSRPGS